MKRFLTFTVMLIIIFIGNVYGFYEDFEYKSYSAYDVTMPYRIYAPAGYDTTQFPVILYLHGAGERGTDNEVQLSGAPYFLFYDGFIINYPMIIIAPQCPDGQQWVDTDWTEGDYSTDEIEETIYLRMVFEILIATIDEYNADVDRIYITGLSMGGYGVWDMLVRYPDTFAAAITIGGAGDSSKAEIIKDIPIWAFHNSGDVVVPVSGVKSMMEAFRVLDSDNLNLTIYDSTSHDAWTQTYRNTDILKWMYRQTKAIESDYQPTISEMIVDQSVDNENHSSFNLIPAVCIVVIVAVLILMIINLIKLIKN